MQTLAQTASTTEGFPLANPAGSLLRLQLDHWGTAEGLPSDAVRGLSRGRDGYLWLATLGGVVRFDGAQFRTYDGRYAPVLRAGANAVYEDERGRLWIATNGAGLASLHEGQVRQWTVADGLPGNIVRALADDGQGGLWLATSGGLVRRTNEGQFQLGPGVLAATTCISLHRDAEARLWIGTPDRGAFVLSPHGQLLGNYTTSDGLPSNQVECFAHDPLGRMLMGTGGGLSRWENGRWVLLLGAPTLPNPNISGVYAPAPETLWLASDSGPLRWHEGRLEVLDQSAGFADRLVRSLLPDTSGNIWWGTWQNGLYRLRRPRIEMIEKSDGLPDAVVNTVTEGGADRLLVALGQGLVEVQHDTVRPLYPHFLANLRVRDTLVAPDGTLWVASTQGLFAFAPGGTAPPVIYGADRGLSDEQARCLLRTRDGSLWVGLRTGVARQLPNGDFELFDRRHGITNPFVNSLYEDRQGTLWLGSDGGGLNYFRNGQWSAYTMAHGLAGDVVFRVAEDAAGNLWIGTNGGVSLLREGRLGSAGIEHGLPSDAIFQVIPDDAGFLWLTTSAGLVRVDEAQLQAATQGARPKVEAITFGREDGLPRPQFTAAGRSLRRADGSLWLATTGGLAILRPGSGQLDKTTLRPRLDDVQVLLTDGRPWRATPGQPWRLPPETREVVFSFSAPEFTAPSRVRYSTRLVGFEDFWTTTSSRTLRFTNLDPGDYVFRVRAANPDGILGDLDATIAFTVEAFFWERPWFWVLVGIVVAAVVWLYWRHRGEVARSREARLQALVDLRTADLRLQSEELQRKNSEITDSLGYAQRVQRALLNDFAEAIAAGPPGFLIFQPRDLVSGDFYWCERQGDRVFFAVADCTGHGMPGALVAVIGHLLLERLLAEQRDSDPGVILAKLHTGVRRTLGQSADTQAPDGIVIGLGVLSLATHRLRYAGARQHLYLVRPGEGLLLISGDSKDVGGVQRESQRVFNTTEVQAPAGTMLYLATDGFAHQLNEAEVKLGTPRLRELLKQAAGRSMDEQRQFLVEALAEHRGTAQPLDDVTLMGLRVP